MAPQISAPKELLSVIEFILTIPFLKMIPEYYQLKARRADEK